MFSRQIKNELEQKLPYKLEEEGQLSETKLHQNKRYVNYISTKCENKSPWKTRVHETLESLQGRLRISTTITKKDGTNEILKRQIY